MLEIYSEVVRDLLNPKSDKKNGLPVREDIKRGFFRKNSLLLQDAAVSERFLIISFLAQGLNKTLVENFSDISKLMASIHSSPKQTLELEFDS